jgi:hypothetical protein
MPNHFKNTYYINGHKNAYSIPKHSKIYPKIEIFGMKICVLSGNPAGK